MRSHAPTQARRRRHDAAPEATGEMQMTGSLFSLDGRVAVITGGLGQLGQQFAAALTAHGALVAVLDRLDPAGQASHDSDRRLYVQADVTDRESLERALARVEARWGIPHVLVNNAALDSPPDAPAAANGAFERYPADLWRRVLDVNVTGVFLCCQTIGA